ncbi:MAG: UDP-N-acetylglucosamine pyrophosphorylase [Ectothiorhodospiraceae bacterium]|nr:UDP-N-acetylglucosamine pyrophosphorylase [Ectothiorhodospiraceae bacterium]
MTPSAPPVAAVILAAGQGKRMKNPDLAKVLHEVGGKPLIEHVVNQAIACEADPVVAIIGHQREAVRKHLDSLGRQEIRTAVQEEQLGTGHAVIQAESALANFEGDVLILSGDVPLTRPETLRSMLKLHRDKAAAVTVMTAELPDPTGYGRVIRDENGRIVKIVEHKDANESEKKVSEINSGIYIFQKKALFDALSRVTNDNAQGEYYLPDVFAIFKKEGKTMEPYLVDSFNEIRGVNTLEQLQELEAMYHEMYKS